MASLRSGVWVSGLFGVQRDPVLKGRRPVNFANPWLLRLSGFHGFGCLSWGPWHCYCLGQRSPLGFPDLPPLQCEAPGWGGDARKSHGYLGGSELGLGTGTQTGPPTHETTKACWQRGRCAGEAGASIPKRTSAGGGGQIQVFLRDPGYCLAGAWGGSYCHRSGRAFGSAAFLVFSGILF